MHRDGRHGRAGCAVNQQDRGRGKQADAAEKQHRPNSSSAGGPRFAAEPNFITLVATHGLETLPRLGYAPPGFVTLPPRLAKNEGECSAGQPVGPGQCLSIGLETTDRNTMSLRLLALAAMLGAGLTAVPAFAQDPPAQPAAPKPAGQPAAGAAAPAPVPGNTTPAISGPQPDWVKLCQPDPQTKKDVCQTSRDLRAETGQTLASVALREDKSGKRVLIMAIPPGMQIQPGVRIVVDQQPPVTAKFSVCFPNVCLVETEATDALIALMKKGTTLNLQALNVQARGVVFPISLNGFGKTFDGAALDPKSYQDEQKKLQDELKKRADEALKSLNTQAAPQ